MRQFASCQQVELSSAPHLPELPETDKHASDSAALRTDSKRFREIVTPSIYHLSHFLCTELDTAGHFKVKENNEIILLRNTVGF